MLRNESDSRSWRGSAKSFWERPVGKARASVRGPYRRSVVVSDNALSFGGKLEEVDSVILIPGESEDFEGK